MKKLLLAIPLISLAVGLSGPAFATERVMGVFTDGNIYVKDGASSAVWNQTTNISGASVGDIEASGNWMLNLISNGANPGEISIKEPAWNSPWEMVTWGNPAATQVLISQTSDGNYRILVLHSDGSVTMKDGTWNSGWWSGTLQPGTGTVSKIVIGGDNIGVIMSNGDFYAKQLTPGQFSHPNNTPWQLEAQNVSSAAMTNDRVAVVDTSGNVYAKEGGMTAAWYNNKALIYDNVSVVRLSANRVCVIKSNQNVECKDGELNAGSVLTYQGASDFQVTPSRFTVLTPGHSAYVMDGPLVGNANGWQFIAIGNITKIATTSY